MIRIGSAEDLADAFGLLRKLAGLSQTTVGQSLGVCAQRIGDYERGRRVSNARTVIRHLAALGYGLAIVPLDADGPRVAPGSTESAEQASGVDGEAGDISGPLEGK